MDSYIICATPRTGSTLLCDLLASTGVAGDPDSYFMTDLDPAWAARWGLPARTGQSEAVYAAARLRAAIEAGRGPTPIFGLRLMNRHLGDLLALIGAVHPGVQSDRARLEAAFGRVLYIHLARADKLAQAVSLVKAQQTGLWHIAPDGSEVERLSPPRPPDYDFRTIAETLAAMEHEDRGWQDWFKAEGIAPLQIGYEELAADAGAVMRRICARLSVRAPAAARLRPGVARLADRVSRDWMRRFRRDADTS